MNAPDINAALETLRDAMQGVPGTIMINGNGSAVLRVAINGDIRLDEDNTLAAITAATAIKRLSD